MQLVGGIFSIRSLSESPRVVFQICDRGLLLIHRISELTTSDFRRSVAKLKLPDACCFYVRRFHDRLIFVLVRLRSARNIGIFALCASFPRYLCAADVSKHVALFDRGLLAPPPTPRFNIDQQAMHDCDFSCGRSNIKTGGGGELDDIRGYRS